MENKYELFESRRVDENDPDYMETIEPFPEIRITMNVESISLLYGLLYNKEDNADTFNGAIALYIDQLIKSIDEGKLVPTANYNMPEMAHLTVDISDAPRIHFRVNCAPGHEDRLKGLLTFLRHKNVGGYIMNKLEQEYETRSIKIDIRNSYKEVSED